MIGVDLITVCNGMTNYSKNPPVRKLANRKYPVETIRRKEENERKITNFLLLLSPLCLHIWKLNAANALEEFQ